jgi:DNA-binding transcriptional LysR family regulator
MYDPVTLDQLRALTTVVEEGSFSAAARKLKRVQSAVSTAMQNLEQHLGVALWDRSTKVPTLTNEGRAVLVAAQRVLAEVDGLKRLTAGLVSGLEARVSLCLDALFPLPALIDVCRAFAAEFPTVDLRIDTQVLSAVSARVLDGSATLGVVSPAGLLPGLERHVLSPIQMISVVAPEHPLASHRGRIGHDVLSRSIQIVLSERGDRGVEDQGVLSPRTWRVADLHTKHMMLRAGLGWGNLPEHLVHDDLRTKKLVAIRPEAWADGELRLFLSAVHRNETVIGPAHEWLLRELGTLCAREVEAARRTRRANVGGAQRPRPARGGRSTALGQRVSAPPGHRRKR